MAKWVNSNNYKCDGGIEKWMGRLTDMRKYIIGLWMRGWTYRWEKWTNVCNG